ncbi:MAG: branched-chain amino acid ABC transporter permease, partial [Rhodobacteraceae bacterium]|nr:branched-chain amino acid ABC transporter permease [Paracoccaceae bacterium]
MGFAGALYAMITTLVSPDLFTAEVTFFVWIALVLGGERTILGAVLGT